MSPRLVVLLLVKLPPLLQLLPLVQLSLVVTKVKIKFNNQLLQKLMISNNQLFQKLMISNNQLFQKLMISNNQLFQKLNPLPMLMVVMVLQLPKSLPLPLWVKRLFIPVFITVMVKNIPMETFKFKPSLLGWRLPFR